MQYISFNGLTINNNSKANITVSEAKTKCKRMIGSSLKRQFKSVGDIKVQSKLLLVKDKHNRVFYTEQHKYKFSRPSENPYLKIAKLQAKKSFIEQQDFYRSMNYQAPTRAMSVRTKSKIKAKIKAWYISNFMAYHKNSARVKFNFITLTLTKENQPHELAYKILNNFLTDMRKSYGKFSYLWVAELQAGKRNGYVKKTNNIHFHMFVDRYFDVQVINDMWCKALRAYGMPSVSLQWSDKNQNPLDLEPVDNLKKLMSYMSKYITKAEDKISTRLWACSKNISQMATGISALFDNHFISELQDLSDDVKIISKGIFHFVYKKLPKIFYSILAPVIEFNKIVNTNYFSPHAYTPLFP